MSYHVKSPGTRLYNRGGALSHELGCSGLGAAPGMKFGSWRPLLTKTVTGKPTTIEQKVAGKIIPAATRCNSAGIPANMMTSCVRKIDVEKKSLTTAVSELEDEMIAAQQSGLIPGAPGHRLAISGSSKKTLLTIGAIGAAALLLLAIKRRKK